LAREDYEIHFFNADGTLSHLLVTNCTSDEDAHAAALWKFAEEPYPFEIWRGPTLVTKGPALSDTQ
jgi:hypothetical protein